MDKLRAVTFFCRAVEAKSFAAAAEVLDVTPSALSKAIGVLEKELNSSLFNRSTRHLSLTPEGAAYYERCRQILQDLEDAESVAFGGRTEPRGTLRVGLHPAVRLAVVSELRNFLEANPNLNVETTTTNTPSMLLTGGLDVIVRIGEMADSGLVARQLGWTEFVVCASPAYLRARGRPTKPEDLANHPAIIYARPDEEPNLEWEFVRGASQRVVAVPMRLVVRDGVGGVDAAIKGCGILRPFEIAVREAVAAGQLEVLLPEWSSDKVALFAVFPKRRMLPAKVQAFLDFVQHIVTNRRTKA